ncbi:MAG: type I-G CRISPR-associated RAMP protein Csb1/Cas7g [Chloroflexia bacterium]
MTTATENLLESMYKQDRVLITAKLELTNGRFLQPTGFPDIGPCIYRDKDGRRWCLVESEQSMANRLEAVCMKDPGVWVDDLKGLPVIAVRDPKGHLLATNLTEAHRIASSHVLEGKLGTRFLGEIVRDKVGVSHNDGSWPIDRRRNLEGLMFALDPAALLHGFQFVDKKFFGGFVGLRQVRLIHGRLEAELSEAEPEVYYQMVKVDQIQNDPEKETNKGQSIAAKSRIVPKDIIAAFEIDVLGLKSLALRDDWKKFLLGLALWKIGAFLKNKPSFDPRSRQSVPSLRLRADCYLRCAKASWSCDAAHGDVKPDDLMQALPNERPDFRKLLSEELGKDWQNSAPGDGEADTGTSMYKGPLVEVTYEPKKPKETKRKAGVAAPGGTDQPEEDEPEEEQE